jgi:hypothetical protein
MNGDRSLPYNNENVFDVDGTSYNNTVRYRRENVRDRLWIFRRELPLRFKPIEGKIGMFIFEPENPLPDGFYVIETALPQADGHHKDLRTAPSQLDFYKTNRVQTAIPFVIGTVKEDSLSMDESKEEASESPNDRPSEDSSQEGTQDLGKSIQNLIKGLFQK